MRTHPAHGRRPGRDRQRKDRGRMTSAETAVAANIRPGRPAVPQMVRLAVRELRSGFSGFHVFIACVALGVMVITAVGALTDSLRNGFERQGELLLGGDIRLSRAHRPAEPEERAWLGSQGRVAELATMRTMARRTDGQDQALAELKGVDAAYPLVGAVQLQGGADFARAVHEKEGAVVAPI